MRFIFLGFTVLVFSMSQLLAIEVGGQAPACTALPTIDSVTAETAQVCLEGVESKKFILLEFMSITCGHCITNLPIVDQLGTELQDHMITKFVTIDRDEAKVRDFWKEYSSVIHQPFAMDLTRQTRTPYEIRYTPTMILLNSDGKVVYKHIGVLEDAQIQEIKDLVSL